MARRSETDSPWARGVQLLLPAGLIAFVGFQSGGYFAGATGTAAVLTGLVVVLALLVARSPLSALCSSGLVAAAALLALAAWQLASSSWSGAPMRAIVDSDRSLLYLAAFLAGALALGTPGRRRRAALGIGLGLFALCLAALLTRTLPDVLPTPHSPVEQQRLAYPLTYWNALGLVSALAALFGVYLASSRAWLPLRLAGAASVPLSVATLVLTFSRGAIVAGVIGLVVFVSLTRNRWTMAGLVATVPTGAAAALLAYDSHLDPTLATAAHDGHRLLALVLVAAAAAALIALALAVALRRWADRPPLEVPGALKRGLQLGVLVAVVALVAAAFASGAASRAYDRFAHTTTHEVQTRQRLTQLSGNGRVDAWRIALRMFDAQPLRGEGSGTFSTYWFARRPNAQDIFDGHSLYLETLGELGLVGLALVLTPLALILTQLLERFRRRRDPLYAVLLAMALAWALHAAIDWDWEMPATGVWLFVIGGAACTAPARRRRAGWAPRILAAAAVVLALVIPGSAAWSQHRLNQASAAYRDGRCTDVARYALDSLRALPVRPEPYRLIGDCDLRVGAADRAAGAFKLGLRRDPRAWDLHYSYALARAAAGSGPLRQIRITVRLNRREAIVQRLRRAFRHSRPRAWPEIADRLPLPPG